MRRALVRTFVFTKNIDSHWYHDGLHIGFFCVPLLAVRLEVSLSMFIMFVYRSVILIKHSPCAKHSLRYPKCIPFNPLSEWNECVDSIIRLAYNKTEVFIQTPDLIFAIVLQLWYIHYTCQFWWHEKCFFLITLLLCCHGLRLWRKL